MTEHISLKWGTLKAWDLETPKCLEIAKKYIELGLCASAACQNDTPEQKDLLCQLVDACNAEEIFLDWNGVYVSKEEAKKYIMEYGR